MGKMKNFGTSEIMQTLMRKSACVMLSLLLLLSAVLPVKAAAETVPVKVVRVGSFEDTFKGSFDPDARPCQGSLFVCLLQKDTSAAAKKSDVRGFCE